MNREKIFIISGEDSGDLHGAKLMESIKKINQHNETNEDNETDKINELKNNTSNSIQVINKEDNFSKNFDLSPSNSEKFSLSPKDSSYLDKYGIIKDKINDLLKNIMNEILDKEDDEIYKLLNCIFNICLISKDYLLEYLEDIKKLKDKKYNSKVRCKVMDIEDLF